MSIIVSLDAKLKVDKPKEVIDSDNLQATLDRINEFNNTVKNGQKDTKV